MKYSIIFLFAGIISFLGLAWMMLPHAYHNLVTQEDETEHFIHLFQGLFIFLIGLALMLWSNRLEKRKSKHLDTAQNRKNGGERNGR